MASQSPKKRQTATERRAAQRGQFGTVSARERRARENAAAGKMTPTADVKEVALTTAQISELLDHPTKTVTEAEFRAQYSYVLKDLRSMGLLTAALFGLLIVLALVLPQIGV
ncbi:MAG: hypothetical protein JNL34_06380 [Anaerolineae bacterium]|nr:hypothetical protein [Anaerolineae bacterium]